ncbi:MAG TPA: PAS domain S-box protein [Reyranella sp.]|nr:PAS domain S-box protein [Reyranella sp.]
MTSPAGSAQPLSSKHRLQLLIDAVADYAIYMLDSDGFVTSWNAGAERIKGYRADEIIGQPFSRFFTAEDQAKGLPATILATARTTGRFETEGWRVRKDGSRFWSNAIVQPVRDEHGRPVGFAKITRDITERRAAHQALLESERRFRLLIEGVVDYALYMLDPSGVVASWNQGAQRMKGYAAGEIVGQHFSRFYTHEDRAAGLPARVLETAAREGRFEAEGWRLRKDGSRFWASVVVDAIRGNDGRLEGFAKITRDITERRAAQQALRDSERQFRLLVSNVVDYGLYMLDPNGIVSSWNAGAERIKGYRAAEIIGQHVSRFYTEHDRAAGVPLRALQTAMTEGRFEDEGWRVRKDGSLFWAHVVIDRVNDETGRLVGFAKITRDNTERREAQLALQEAQAQRAQAQKMDALGQLTGGVAHDFNNLLMIVVGQAELLKRKLAGDPAVSTSIAAIELAAQRGAALTGQLLTFARRQSVNPVVLNLPEHIAGFEVMLKSSIGSSVRLATAVAADCWLVKVDPGELELALVNLALNGRDAMPGGGTVTLTAENVTLVAGENPPGLPMALAGEFVALAVADTGSGIAPDLVDKVFDPFFTTKDVGKGSGLGLSQVHGFAHQSGGTVMLDSRLGRGTTVTLYLPRSHEDVAASEAEAAVDEGGTGRVLLVEDNPEVATATQLMLEQLGYSVRLATDGAAALAAIDAERVDLVMTDIVMAGSVDGLGVARALYQRKPDLPVLLVTGYSDAAAKVAGEFTVLRKPFQMAELSRTVARMIADRGQPTAPNVVRLRDMKPTPGRDKS